MTKSTIYIVENHWNKNLVNTNIVHKSEEKMTEELVKELVDFAIYSSSLIGFEVVENWDAKIHTMDGDKTNPEDRAYTVTFINRCGGCLVADGITYCNSIPESVHEFKILKESD